MKKIIALGAALAAALAVSVSASATPCCITNGSFETGGGSTTGWTTTPNGGSILATGGGAPGAGSYYAYEVAGNGDAWVTLSQSFVAPAGRVYGWANFDDGEDTSCSFYPEVVNYEARIQVDGKNVFYRNSDTSADTGWVQWSALVSNVGAHTVSVQVLNDGDSACDSVLSVDGIVWDARLTKLP